MTAAAKLFEFFSGFNIPAYPSTSVPDEDNVKFPYLTYEFSESYLDEGEIASAVNVYYRTESESVPNAKAREIGEAIGRGGVCLPCDGGYIWIKRGSPFLQAVVYESDSAIKRRYLNITFEYLT